MLNQLKKLLTDVVQPAAGKIAEEPKVPKAKRAPKPKKETVAEEKPKKPRAGKNNPAEDPEKIRANKRGEPWVKILSMELNPEDPGQGAFELDWNDKFVANLLRAGYQGRTDADIVDNWFQTVCRNIALETWQQEQADPEKRKSNRRDLGNGRTEIS